MGSADPLGWLTHPRRRRLCPFACVSLRPPEVSSSLCDRFRASQNSIHIAPYFPQAITMANKRVVPYPAESSSTEPIKGDIPAITESPKEAAPIEVVCILDVRPLASRPPTEGQGSGATPERPSVAKGAVVRPFVPLAPGPSSRSASLGKARKARGRASSPYQRGVGMRPKPMVIPPPLVVPRFGPTH
jgi:hypothetical protein